MAETVQPGRRIRIHYTLAMPDGTVVDSTRDGEPASWVVGSGECVELLERRLIDLCAGDRRRFEISADESSAGQTYDPASRQILPRTDFPPDAQPVPGQIIGFTAPDGSEVPGWIVEANEHEVIVDFSHPLIGRDLVFDVEILAVEPA
jgi:FKBP-type peptidyl-prolyl cis-trans isomerase SlpA